MKLIGLIGPAGVGKSTAAAHLVTKYGFVELSMAGPLKDLCARFFGWDHSRLDELEYKEEQDPNLPDGWTRRKVLQFVGTELMRHIDPDIWVKKVLRQMDDIWFDDLSAERSIVISDVRFLNEVKLIQANSGIIVRVERDDPDFKSTTPAHTSESELAYFSPGYVLRAEFGVDRVQAATDRMMGLLKQEDSLSV